MVGIIFLIYFLILLNCFVPIMASIKLCVKRRTLEINHILLFSVGYLYYLVIPIIVGLNGYFIELPAMDLWFSIFKGIPLSNLMVYLLMILSFYLAFLVGSLFRKTKGVRGKTIDLNFNKSVLGLYYFFCVILSFLYIFKFRNDFFSGYSSDASLNFSEKGPFIALSLVILALSIIYNNKLNFNYNSKLTLKQIVINKYFLFYFFIGVLILSLGGRLYFISGLLMVFVYYTVYFKRIKLSKAFLLGTILVILMGFIGLLRGGYVTFSISGALFNIVQEPLYTSFSLVSFLKAGNIEMFNTPIFLLSSFINMVPTFIFPQKLMYIISPSELGYVIFNPLGALNSFVSFTVNFGFIGSILMFFFLGFFLESLKNNKNSILSKTIYIMISGFLTFTFFRDGFETSIVKNIFQFSIMIPILIIFSSHIISIAIRKNN